MLRFPMTRHSRRRALAGRDAGPVTAAERARERALGLTLLADTVILLIFAAIAVASGSLSLLAETLRGAMLFLLGVYAFQVMRQVHRRALVQYDFGTGKVEQFANLLASAGLLLGAAWVLWKAVRALDAPPATDEGLMLASTLAALLNLVVNVVGFLLMWRSGRDGVSVVMRGQIRARFGKVVVSALVTLAIAVAALMPGTFAGRHADAAGAVLVGVVMVLVAVSLLRLTLPDLLDRTLSEGRQVVINRVLARFFEGYEALGAVRSRQAGGTLHVEVTLGFRGLRPFSEVAATARAVTAALEEELPGAEVVVIPKELR